MPTPFRFVCYEDADPTYPASLVARHTSLDRFAYFDLCDFDLTFDITSMAVTSYTDEREQPLIAVAVASQPSRTTLYVPLDDLADAIAKQQDDALWRLLRMTTRYLAPEHRLA